MKSQSEHHEGPRPRRTAQRAPQRGFHLALASALCWVALAAVDAPRAWALQGGEDPSTLPVLIDKRYGLKNQLTAHVQFSTPIAAKFVESTGVVGGVDYGIFDWFSVGLVGGFFGGGEANIVEQVRALNRQAELTDLDRMQWFGGVDLTFTPIYGRISFASEYNPAFDLFAFVGGGAMGTERQFGGLNELSEPSQTDVTGYGNFGFGFRFHVLDWLAVRTEYRQLIYPENEIPLEEQRNPGGTTDVGGGISTAQQFQIGLQVRFGL